MEITFVANARVAGYRAGQVYKIQDTDLTPMLRGLLAKGRHLALLDPLSLEDVDGSGKSADNPKPSKQTSRSGNEQATAPDGGKRAENGEGDSTSERRPEELH